MTWCTVKLGEATHRIGGGTPSRNEASYWGGNLPWFTVADLKDVDDIQSLTTSREFITRKGLMNSAAKLVPAGAIVFSNRVVVGKVGIAKNELVTNQDFSSFVPGEGIDPEFLAYFLIKTKNDLRLQQRGATIKGVTTGILESIDLPKPSMKEQRRIVARVKHCMKYVDEIMKLTIENDREGNQVQRSGRRGLLGDPFQLPDGWEEKRLDELADVIYGISAAISSNKNPDLGPPIVRMANISIDGNLDLSDLRYCRVPKGRESHFALKPGDLLLNWRSGSAGHVGKTAIFNESELYTCASFILRIRPKENVCNNRFLRHVLNFMRAEGVFSGHSRMQVNHKLNASEFSAFPIRVPSNKQLQEHIADQLDAIEAFTNQIKNEISNKFKEIKTLRESILRKAFAGEL
jgi:type I restriction enzyme S subunit